MQSCLAGGGGGGWVKEARLPCDLTQKPFSLQGVAQTFHRYPLEMDSPKGGGAGEAKPWLSKLLLSTKYLLLNLGRYTTI